VFAQREIAMDEGDFRPVAGKYFTVEQHTQVLAVAALQILVDDHSYIAGSIPFYYFSAHGE
jgi:hypothetical protein